MSALAPAQNKDFIHVRHPWQSRSRRKADHLRVMLRAVCAR